MHACARLSPAACRQGEGTQTATSGRNPFRAEESPQILRTDMSAPAPGQNTSGITHQKEKDQGEWYQQVIQRAELIDYSDISGCYILRPAAFGMWERIQRYFDGKIKAMGVQNCYFPLFVSQKALTAEKDHIEGFAPEVAWVTRSGSSDLAEPIAIRPTSETIIYPCIRNWIQSHRDLPLKLNQWTNVVRWEFKHPMPFIRSREFLWQEGHTAFATKAEADAEVLDILELYRQVYEDLMAVPVVKGRKSEKEKFAGALYTTTVEGFIPSAGRAIQGATSHCLGQNFAKMFKVEFESDAATKEFVWQNSWGLTTRTLGVMVLVHSDNKGLVVPPRMAPTQVVIIPIVNSKLSAEETQAIRDRAHEFGRQLSALDVRVRVDDRDNYTPGFKYNHWELHGACLRVEIGPKDMTKQTVMVARRDTGAKTVAGWENLAAHLVELLETVQCEMFERAKRERDERIGRATDFEDFMATLDQRKMVLAPWCEEVACEEDLKKRSAEASRNNPDSTLSGAAKSLCIPFEQPQGGLAEGAMCFCCGTRRAKSHALFGRSY